MLLFAPEIAERREKLRRRIAAGATEADCRQLLALDADDRVALFELARLSRAAGDVAAAEGLLRRGLTAHPCDRSFYLELAELAPPLDPAEAGAWRELGVRKLLGDPEASEQDPVALQTTADELAARRAAEPPAVTTALLPWRHIHELQEALGNELERELVDAILRDGARSAPLLVGVLRGMAEGYLPEGGELMAESALALLGEIASPQTLEPLVEFALVDDEALSDIAGWALRRAAAKHPAEAVAAMREFGPGMPGAGRGCIAETIATMPETSGRAAALAALFTRLGEVAEEERGETFLTVATALLSIDGRAAPLVIRKALDQAGKTLPDAARSSTNKLLRAVAADPSLLHLEPEPETLTVYEVCCSDRLDAYEQGDEPDDLPLV